ncbi:hypothetical protein CLV30_1102 [Haloactinopolyspora alba]|uniref:Uncharacterized protein n=1 Tax=Haloactinopolyspora alba TaxID=648780 RepID=A0A2P8DYQ9_9ACTN|nr:hypothetical protein CLV30_1102 [Haloactinopolyspora alba]
MYSDDDGPRRTDLRTRVVAVVLVLCLVAGFAPFLLNLVF